MQSCHYHKWAPYNMEGARPPLGVGWRESKEKGVPPKSAFYPGWELTHILNSGYIPPYF